MTKEKMRVYAGRRDKYGRCIVHVIHGNGESHYLPLHDEIVNHSPTGFEVGYDGSGPAQLALAIIADATNDSEIALELHQAFKRRVISRLDRNKPWKLTQFEVLVVLDELALERRERKKDAQESLEGNGQSTDSN